jgi:hypothetical protein
MSCLRDLAGTDKHPSVERHHDRHHRNERAIAHWPRQELRDDELDAVAGLRCPEDF